MEDITFRQKDIQVDPKDCEVVICRRQLTNAECTSLPSTTGHENASYSLSAKATDGVNTFSYGPVASRVIEGWVKAPAKNAEPPPPEPLPSHPSVLIQNGNPLLSILALIAKYHSQEISATPKRLAADLELDPEITLAHMWKYHNEQFITYGNNGKRPELDMPFSLSPKAWERIKIVPA